MRWLALAVVIVVGIAVLAARTGERAALPRPVATPTSVPRPAAAEHVDPTPAPAARVPTRVRSLATPTATAIVAQHAPTPTTVATRKAVATRAATATIATAPKPSPTAAVVAKPVAGAVALTFDAGADRGYAEDILDILAEEHAVASFGITGNWAKANPDLVRRMAADGHLVFNHTLDHRSFTGISDALGGLSAAQRRAELDQADAIIAPLIGHSTRPFYRLPYGDDDAKVAADVGSDGYTRKIGWTVDSDGWRGLQSADILARCLKLAAPHSIFVMHVGHQSQDAIALPQLVHELRDRGFTFERVDEN